MAERIHKQAETIRRTEEELHDDAKAIGAAATAAENGEKLKAELDDLLDEIDGVLETNADEFVKSYIQKGGQ